MIVTGTGSGTEVGHISGMLKSTPTLKTPLTAQLDTLTLWIAAAAGLTIAIMFALGISRGQSTQTIFTTAIALALAAVPMAMPTVLQVILSNGLHDARRPRRRREEPRLGRDPGLDLGDQLGQDRHPDDEPGHGHRGDRSHRPLLDHRDGLRPRRRGRARRRQHEHDRGRDPALPGRQRRQARRRQGRGRSHRGRAARPRAQGQAGRRRHAGRLPAARDPAVRPDVQADGRLRQRQGRVREGGRPGLRQGGRPGGDRAGRIRPCQRQERSLGRRAEQAVQRGDGSSRRQGPAHHGRGHAGPRPDGVRPQRRPAVDGRRTSR